MQALSKISVLLLGAGFIVQASAEPDDGTLIPEPETYTIEEVEIIANEVLNDLNTPTAGSQSTSSEQGTSGQRSRVEKRSQKKPAGRQRGFVPKKALTKFKKSRQSIEHGKQVNNLFKQAFEKEKLADFSGAIQLLTLANELSPNNERILLAKGRILVKSSNYDSAVEVLTPLSEQPISQWQTWYWKGSAELMLGRLLAAEQSLDEALSRQGNKSQIWLNRALIEQERKDHETALQLLAIAHDLDPENPQILLAIAYSSEAIGDLETARSSYRHFLSLSGTNRNTVPLRHIILDHLTEMEVPKKAEKPETQEQLSMEG